jgi:hypothetical protein
MQYSLALTDGSFECLANSHKVISLWSNIVMGRINLLLISKIVEIIRKFKRVLIMSLVILRKEIEVSCLIQKIC